MVNMVNMVNIEIAYIALLLTFISLKKRSEGYK